MILYNMIRLIILHLKGRDLIAYEIYFNVTY